ncbi:hypothetical protein M0R45_002366 [Rubus argutus]|uniref:Uncharacterized protein n=1 Tax=Rubus argutus TaxID=59490 RepID=A0AAW1VJ78_RUBAR
MPSPFIHSRLHLQSLCPQTSRCHFTRPRPPSTSKLPSSASLSDDACTTKPLVRILRPPSIPQSSTEDHEANLTTVDPFAGLVNRRHHRSAPSSPASLCSARTARAFIQGRRSPQHLAIVAPHLTAPSSPKSIKATPHRSP